ncbi:MAG UNVERIFIED_CONTAM: hypothetical protein LVT10_00825 [Anaerolineae bacterium]
MQGNLGNFNGHGEGVAVIMRYTLRLLTLQQFQRATTLIAACEVLRRQDEAVWGKEPFRIGLWVGANSTPNYTADSLKAITQKRGPYQGKVGGSGTPVQLKHCPWCGSEIHAGKNIIVEVAEHEVGGHCNIVVIRLGNARLVSDKQRGRGCPLWSWMKKSTVGCPLC